MDKPSTVEEKPMISKQHRQETTDSRTEGRIDEPSNIEEKAMISKQHRQEMKNERRDGRRDEPTNEQTNERRKHNKQRILTNETTLNFCCLI